MLLVEEALQHKCADLLLLDIGPDTAAAYAERLGKAGSIVWNGPVGVFEIDVPTPDGTKVTRDERRAGNDQPDRIQAVGARGQRRTRLEAQVALAKVRVVFGDVGRVGNDHAIDVAGHRFEPAALEQAQRHIRSIGFDELSAFDKLNAELRKYGSLLEPVLQLQRELAWYGTSAAPWFCRGSVDFRWLLPRKISALWRDHVQHIARGLRHALLDAPKAAAPVRPPDKQKTITVAAVQRVFAAEQLSAPFF